MRYIVANWKSNMTLEQINNWLKEFDELSQGMKFKNTILLAPPFPYLETVKKYATLKNNIEACGQDVSLYEPGAHTGEVNAKELADFGKYCIVGHSERKESQEVVVKKRDACLAVQITPIVCFISLDQLNNYYTQSAVFAWEDPQNISHDGKYEVKDVDEIRQGFIDLKSKYSEAQILYGGSVNIDNAKNLAKIEQLDGVLIGHASLNPRHFLDIIIEFDLK